MITKAQQFAVHIVTRFQTVHDRANTLLAECPTPEARAAALVEIIHSVECSISEFAEAWRQHWAYQAFAEMSPHLYRQTPDHNPYAVAVWRHDAPGRGGAEFSYMVGQVSDLIDPVNLRWGMKNLGTFAFMRAIEHEDEPHPTRVQSAIYAIKRKAAYADLSRQVLRRWLPKSLHHLIREARKQKEVPKASLLNQLWQNGMPEAREIPIGDFDLIRKRQIRGPEWYQKATKAELWVMTLSADERKHLAAYIDPLMFYKAVIGTFHPDQVPDLIAPQQRMRTMRMF